MDELVQRLSQGDHPVAAGGPMPSAENLKQSVDRGYVHVKFTGTRGGTDLGVSLDQDASDFSAVDYEQATGVAHIVGTLTLNFVRVRCVADLDLATLTGTGHLEVLGEV